MPNDLPVSTPDAPAESWDPIQLSSTDQAAMPASLRTALLNWHRQYRAMQAGASFQDAQVVPERTTPDHLTRAMLHAVHGLLDRAHFQVWVDRYRKGRDDRDRVQGCTPLFEMAIEARRLDLLDALLSNPDLVPTHTSSNGGPSFNGSLFEGRRRAVNTEPQGPAFLEALTQQWPAFQRAQDPILGEFPHRERSVRLVKMETDGATNGYRRRLGISESRAVHQTGDEPSPAMLDLLGQAQGARLALHINLVGLAVLHGWPEGVQRLLEAGLNPYTLQGTRRLSHSAIVLASVFDEPACAAVLIQHSSFAMKGRYGEWDKDIGRSGSQNRSEITLWRQLDPALEGGFDWSLLCRSPVMDDPVVRAAMQARWHEQTPKTRERMTQHDAMAARRWERAVLSETIDHDVAVQAVHPLRTRARL